MKRTPPQYSITLELPSALGNVLSQLKQNISRPLARLNLRYVNRDGKNMLPVILLVLVGLIVAGIVINTIRLAGKPGDTRIQLKPARATQPINKEFSFPLKDDKGKVVTNIKYTIESAELRDDIVVKGQRATSVKGRTFLIVSIKIANDYNKGIEIQAKDYMRLVVNGNEKEQLAADIHNDPVTVQAISTKYTRLGFPINDTDKNLSLRIGELNGQKETIALAFK